MLVRSILYGYNVDLRKVVAVIFGSPDKVERRTKSLVSPGECCVDDVPNP